MKANQLKSTAVALSIAAFSSTQAIAQEQTNATSNSLDGLNLIMRSAAPKLVQRSNETVVVSRVPAGKSTIAVEILAHRCDFRSGGPNVSRTVQLVEFAIHERGGGPFHWYCWESANSYPHDFKLFTTEDRNSYACFVSSESVKLFRVMESNETAAERRLFLEKRTRMGEMEPLRIAFLHETLGREVFYSENALYDPVTVDGVFEVASELHITLHGRNPDQRFTFALKAGHWKLVGN